MKSLVLLSIFLLVVGCTSDRPKLEELRSELKSIQAESKTAPTSEEKTLLAERALSLMDKANPKEDDVDPFVEAEALSAEAEALFALEAFQEGLSIFEAALEMDAGNERANAYLALLKPLWAMRGMHWRLGSTEQVDFSLILLPGFQKDVESKVTWFFLTPTPDLPLARSVRDMQKLILVPWSKAVIAANKHWDILKTNRDLDITLTLPQVFVGQEKLRLRWEDSIAGYNLYLATAVYFRLTASYNGSLEPAWEKRNPNWHPLPNEKTPYQKLAENLADPEFGVLADPDFFT
jgi:hypothetical protein